MSFFSFRQRLSIEGIMPERALLRLKRAEIDVFNVKKTQKNRILLSVNRKDVEKVFAIYPKVCYNGSVRSAYEVRPIAKLGMFSYAERLYKRLGFVLGALLFLIACAFADSLVFGVDVQGDIGYHRETLAALAENGIQPFSRYRKGGEDAVCAQLLALPDIEFCSVKKRGLSVVVELRSSPFPVKTLQKGALTASRGGEILSIVALRGTLLKKKGEQVQAGEPLVADYFETQSGERTKVEVIARARLACTYETTLSAPDAQTAFAICYLELQLTQAGEITSMEITQTDETFHVKISYEILETLNM